MKHFLRLMGRLCPISNLYKTKFSAMLAVTTLFMCLIAAVKAPAQTGAAVNMDEIQPLQIGDAIPEELWHLPLQVVNHPEGKEIITLNDYRGKLIILDFWATWCGPCITSMYKLDTLQAQFAEAIMVIPTTYERPDKVLPFVENKGWALSTAVAESHLINYFPHRSIPHQVWIINDTVFTVTGADYTSADNISKVLTGREIPIEIKSEDMAFNLNAPLLIDGNGGGVQNLYYQSVVTGFINTWSGGTLRTQNQISLINKDFITLFHFAFRKEIPFRQRFKFVVFEIGDREINRKIENLIQPKFTKRTEDAYQRWLTQSVFSYGLYFRDELPVNVQNNIIIEDLNRFFYNTYGISVHLGKRSVKCLVIRSIHNNDKILSQGGESSEQILGNRHVFKNVLFEDFIQYLEHYTKDLSYPIIDNTDIVGNIDLTLNTRLTSLEEIRQTLQPYGLEINEEEVELDVIVVTDSCSSI